MKIFSLPVLLLLISLSTYSQPAKSPIEVYSGPELNMANNIQVPEIFGHDETGYYVYSYDYRPAVEFLDTKFRTVRRKHLDLQMGLRGRKLIGLYHFHDSIYMFSTEERMKRMLLFVETIDKKTLLQNNDDRLLMNVPNLAGWGSDFGLKLSRKENKLLVFSRLDVLSKNIQDVHFLLFGEGLTLEWEAEQRIIYPGRPPRQSIIKVSDDGDVYFISLLDDQNLRSIWDDTKNRYHMVAVTENGKYVNTYSLELPELYIRGVQIEPDINHRLVCVGFYSPTHFRSMVDGIFYFELDNKLGVFQNQRMYEFEPWFLTEALAKDPKKEPKELFDFRIRQLIRRNNGDFIMLAENQFDQNYDTYQNIIAANFSVGGRLNWVRVIPKRQNIEPSSHFNHSSYSVHAPWYTDRIYMIFNDSYKNEFISPEDRLKPFHPNDKAILRVVGLGPMGEMTGSIVYRKTKKRMKTPLPRQNYDMLNNEMIIPLLRMKSYNYFKLTFNE